MNLISCDNCAAVLDKDKLKFPEEYTGSNGEVDETKAVWDSESDNWCLYVKCPVCKEKILDREA